MTCILLGQIPSDFSHLLFIFQKRPLYFFVVDKNNLSQSNPAPGLIQGRTSSVGFALGSVTEHPPHVLCCL